MAMEDSQHDASGGQTEEYSGENEINQRSGGGAPPLAEKARVPDGRMDAGHGDVNANMSAKLVGLRQRKPERKATGMKAVVSSFHYAVSEAGPLRGTLP